jgi:predicted RNase H-like nuclease (RuvC/YqgF family)
MQRSSSTIPLRSPSWNFVQKPAANRALFSQETFDVSAKTIQQNVSTKPIQAKNTNRMKAIFTQLGSNPLKLAAACKFLSENDGATEDQAIQFAEGEAQKSELETLKETVASLTAERDALAAKVAEMSGEKETLSTEAAKVPALEAEKTALETKLSAKTKEADGYVVKLSRFTGVPALKLSAADADATNKDKAKTGYEAVREHFSKKP